MIFPFPSSPHCAPIRIVLAMTFWAKFCPDARSRHSGLASQDKRGGRTRKTILDTPHDNEVSERNMRTILLIILVLLLLGALPTWPYSSGWGYYPGGGLLLLIILILVLWRA
jgi:Protein of unknown function (DUF3309)